MEQIQKILKEQFNADLADTFKKCAYFEPVMDYIEFISADEITVSDRVDEFLTLIYRADSTDVIGFRLKGFRHAFDRLKHVLKLTEEDFVPLTMVIERIFEQLGEEVCQDKQKLHSYRVAFKLAKEHDVTFDSSMLLAA